MRKEKQSKLEFIILMAGLMSLVALSIDAILPALDQIGISIQINPESNNSQLLITMIFLGLGFGQLISGPISDSFGRKPIIYVGFIVFVLASFICITAPNLEVMIVGRILQGIGLSAPRTISIAMVRDSFSGDYMAKIMSFIVVIFILIPVVAPAIGKLMLDAYGWKFIFYSQLIYGCFIMIWLWRRQPETLKKPNRIKFSLQLFIDGTKEFIKRNGEFAVNIALVINGIPQLGVIYVPVTKTIYVADVKNRTAFKANINSHESSIEEVLGFAKKLTPKNNNKGLFQVVGSRSHMSKETLDFVEKLKQEGKEVEVVSKGSSLKFCLIAEGNADAYPRFAPTMEWDTAAGQAICNAVGVKVISNKTKKELLYNKENLLNPWFLVSQ